MEDFVASDPESAVGSDVGQALVPAGPGSASEPRIRKRQRCRCSGDEVMWVALFASERSPPLSEGSARLVEMVAQMGDDGGSAPPQQPAQAQQTALLGFAQVTWKVARPSSEPAECVVIELAAQCQRHRHPCYIMYMVRNVVQLPQEAVVDSAPGFGRPVTSALLERLGSSPTAARAAMCLTLWRPMAVAIWRGSGRSFMLAGSTETRAASAERSTASLASVARLRACQPTQLHWLRWPRVASLLRSQVLWAMVGKHMRWSGSFEAAATSGV